MEQPTAREQILEEPNVPDSPPRPARRSFLDLVLGKRRRFLVHRRSQLRATLLTSAVVLVLLVLLNLSLHNARTRSSAALIGDAPELEQIILSQNRTEFVLVLLGSLVFLGGVFVVTILETHKTAGAALNLARHMSRVRDGDFSVRLRLRKDDNLGVLEQAFNDMVASLQERAWTDAEILDELAAQVDRVATPIEAETLASKLREQSAWRRQSAG